MTTPESLQRVSSSLLRLIQGGELAGSAVVLVDLGGRPLLGWRAPGIGFFYHDLALAKAWTCSALLRTAAPTGDQLSRSPAVAAYLAHLGQGQFAPLPGGALLLDGPLTVCGVGVAGPEGRERDEAILGQLCAHAGVQMHRPDSNPDP